MAVRDLHTEALFLAGLVAELMPGEPEALGLAALIGLAEARRSARLDAAGGYVPLAEQDVTLWDTPMLLRAERLLAQAQKQGQVGRLDQCGAAPDPVNARVGQCAVVTSHMLRFMEFLRAVGAFAPLVLATCTAPFMHGNLNPCRRLAAPYRFCLA